MKAYTPRYTDWLKEAGASLDTLPIGLQQLVEKYEAAHHALAQSNEDMQHRLLFIVVKADAVVCAAIYALYKNKLQNVMRDDEGKMDKVKLMALKAKALKLKWKK